MRCVSVNVPRRARALSLLPSRLVGALTLALMLLAGTTNVAEPTSAAADEDQARSSVDQAIESWQAGLNLIRTVQGMICMARLPVGRKLFRAAARNVLLINRLAKSSNLVREREQCCRGVSGLRT